MRPMICSIDNLKGYEKRYLRRCRKIVKKHHAKKNRQLGKRVIYNENLPNEAKIVDSSKHYYM